MKYERLSTCGLVNYWMLSLHLPPIRVSKLEQSQHHRFCVVFGDGGTRESLTDDDRTAHFLLQFPREPSVAREKDLSRPLRRFDCASGRHVRCSLRFHRPSILSHNYLILYGCPSQTPWKAKVCGILWLRCHLVLASKT